MINKKQLSEAQKQRLSRAIDEISTPAFSIFNGNISDNQCFEDLNGSGSVKTQPNQKNGQNSPKTAIVNPIFST